MAYARKNSRSRSGGSNRRSGGTRRGAGSRRSVRTRSGGGGAVRIELVVPGMNASRGSIFQMPEAAPKRSRF